jgi:xanthine dehydrogenase accessory factor
LTGFWPQALQDVLDQKAGQETACVLVTVLSVKGSAPRSVGSRMIVTQDGQLRGSIGGGNLEFEATALAGKLLETPERAVLQRHSYGLGPRLNQCCGGAVELCFELISKVRSDWLKELNSSTESPSGAWLLTALDRDRVTKWVLLPGDSSKQEFPIQLCSTPVAKTGSDSPAFCLLDSGGEQFLLEHIRPNTRPLYLFGAGHVGRAVVEAIKDLPFDVTWIDSRWQFAPESVPASTVFVHSDKPDRELHARKDALYLVMTHSHQLDEDICYEILASGEFAFLGLIGSATKRARFVHRLARRGISETMLERLVCPVGHCGITGKRPATIAVSIAAQLLLEQVPDHWR